MRGTLPAAGLSGAAALLGVLGGATWYYGRQLTEPPAELWPPEPDEDSRVEIVQVRPDRVALDGPAAERPGVWGLTDGSAYLRIHGILDRNATGCWRASRVLEGQPRPGTAHLDATAYPEDPAVLGLPVEEVSYQTPLGPAPAWWFPPPEGADGAAPDRARTSVVAVHGRSSRRNEAFRLVPTLHRWGAGVLSIAYRNDPEGPRSPDNRSHLGATEWEDVEAAVRFALAGGAERVVLLGYSMGALLSLAFLQRSQLAERVGATILEAPVLDWEPVLRLAARARGVPRAAVPVLLPATMAWTSSRVGIDWSELAFTDEEHRLPPTLLIYGTADETVPIDITDAFATARPEVTTLRMEGAGHGRCWNHDPVRHQAGVKRFLTAALDRG